VHPLGWVHMDEIETASFLERHHPIIEIGMLVRPRWKPYLPEALGPFIFEITKEELQGIDKLPLDTSFTKLYFRVLQRDEVGLVIKMIGRKAIILLDLKFFCIDKEFLTPWHYDPSLDD